MAVIIKGIDILEPSAGTNSLQWAWQNGGPASGEVLIFGENGLLTNGTPVASGSTGTTTSSAIHTISEMNSLRFDESSYLSRTFGSGGDVNVWTYSLWVKRGNISNAQHLLQTFSSGGFGIDGAITFNTDGNLDFTYDFNGGTRQRLTTTSVYRDTSSWYHVVFSAQDRVSPYKITIHVNGVEITSFTTNEQPDGTGGHINSGYIHYIGAYGTTANFNGYLANIHFIDGQALDASHFGEETSGVWVPKAYDPDTSGAYGTNGFHLDFTNNDTALNISTYDTSTHDIFGDSSAIATYSLDGNATDLGGSYDATASNITYGTGKFGQAAVFNGSNSLVSRTDQVLPTSGDYSISLWFNPASGFLSTLWGLFSSFQLSTSNGIAIYGDSSNFICNFGNSKMVYTLVPDARWIHCVAVLNGTTGRLYLDGTHIGSITGASNTITTSCDFKLGYAGRTSNGKYSYNQYFNGSIDEVRVFNKALSIGEIETLYATGGDKYFLDKSGSHNHWLAV